MILIHDDKFPVFFGRFPIWSISAAPPEDILGSPVRYPNSAVVGLRGASSAVVVSQGAAVITATRYPRGV